MVDVITTYGNETVIAGYDDNWQPIEGAIEWSDGNTTTTASYDSNWHLTGATSVTNDGDQTTSVYYDSDWQVTGAEIRTSGPSGNGQDEVYGPNWQLTYATQSITSDDGAQTENISVGYGPGWIINSATVTFTSDANPLDTVREIYDANWHLTSASTSNTVISDTAQGGEITAVTAREYDGNWNFYLQNTVVTDYISSTLSYQLMNRSDGSGDTVSGSASWVIGGISGYESWNAGTPHQISLSETATPGTDVPLDRLIDETLDNAGQMTSAKILTTGIQGQAFTSTEEDYDANWHLTSWHGQGPNGYDQTVTYTV